MPCIYKWPYDTFSRCRRVFATFGTNIWDFERCRSKIKAIKCVFARTSVTFLGYTASKEGKVPGVNNIKMTKDCHAPRNVNELQWELGLLSCYRNLMLAIVKLSIFWHGFSISMFNIYIAGHPKNYKQTNWTYCFDIS